MSVEVGGNTGSCSHAGILTFHGNTGDVSVNVTADRQGNFVARVTIPKGTFPTAYKLELTVDCNGQLQRAQGDLSVLNIAPTAANDSAKTIQDTPVSIPVTDNDRNLDPGTGYPTLVLESSPPTHGTTEVLPDNRIRYTPDKGFVGQDQFQYGFCDDIINAAGQADWRHRHRHRDGRRRHSLPAFVRQHLQHQGESQQGSWREDGGHHGDRRPQARGMPVQTPPGRDPPRP